MRDSQLAPVRHCEDCDKGLRLFLTATSSFVVCVDESASVESAALRKVAPSTADTLVWLTWFYIRARPQATIDPTTVTPADAASLVCVFDMELAMASALGKDLGPKLVGPAVRTDAMTTENQGFTVDHLD